MTFMSDICTRSGIGGGEHSVFSDCGVGAAQASFRPGRWPTTEDSAIRELVVVIHKEAFMIYCTTEAKTGRLANHVHERRHRYRFANDPARCVCLRHIRSNPCPSERLSVAGGTGIEGKTAVWTASCG
ncbi:hypothetical protein TNCV_4101781 [Trichonephila clavipes]|nr:hypothetical protein TNCV_4101781 [Trichonephila clavipes]